MKSKTKKWGKHGEVRLNDDGTIDEIIVKDCDIHLEQMNTGSWWMGIYVKQGNKMKDCMHVQLFNRKGRPVVVTAETDEAKISEGFKK